MFAMKSAAARAGLGLVVAAVVCMVALAVAGWWLWRGFDARQDRGAPAAMRECMTTCRTWHMVGSLYRRGFCTPCEDLEVCAGPRETPTPACVDALRTCYHGNDCMGAVRVACDTRCSRFIDQLSKNRAPW